MNGEKSIEFVCILYKLQSTKRCFFLIFVESKQKHQIKPNQSKANQTKPNKTMSGYLYQTRSKKEKGEKKGDKKESVGMIKKGGNQERERLSKGSEYGDDKNNDGDGDDEDNAFDDEDDDEEQEEQEDEEEEWMDSTEEDDSDSEFVPSDESEDDAPSCAFKKMGKINVLPKCKDDENLSFAKHTTTTPNPMTKNFNITFTISHNSNQKKDKNADKDSEEDDDDDVEEEEDQEEEYDCDCKDEEESEEEDEEDKDSDPENEKDKKRMKLEVNNEAQDDDVVLNKLIVQLEQLQKEHSGNNFLQQALKMCNDAKQKPMTPTSKKSKLDSRQEKANRRMNMLRFRQLLSERTIMSDLDMFETMPMDEQKAIIKKLQCINEVGNCRTPYRMTLIEADMPPELKFMALRKISALRTADPGSGEYTKLRNWVDGFMQIPFGKYIQLPISVSDGFANCSSFMNNAVAVMDEAVYGMEDAKMQVIQLLGTLVSNPNAIGSAIAIQGPPGTGKTSLVKEGISKILNRPFSFIALGGATDSSFLEGHSYTYEGSTWGKLVATLLEKKCMNPVFYFDELDKVSDTPKGEEIVGILTHLTDTSQNTQFRDKYFADIDFDLSKCLFIFSYNDESKINPILKDRMYRIHTKGYEGKQKVHIAQHYLIPKILEQVSFKKDDVAITDEALKYIIDSFCEQEQGVRNLKRCLEVVFTKLNLFRLMNPSSLLFGEKLASMEVTFPFQVTKEKVDVFLKRNELNAMHLSMFV